MDFNWLKRGRLLPPGNNKNHLWHHDKGLISARCLTAQPMLPVLRAVGMQQPLPSHSLPMAVVLCTYTCRRTWRPSTRCMAVASAPSDHSDSAMLLQ